MSNQHSSLENNKETAFKVTGIARVVAVRDNLLRIRTDEGALTKNEVVYVCMGEQRLRAEVLRIMGRTADIQVFEDTTGVRIGDKVEMTGELLSVTLGPGLLGQVYDGLQNPLSVLASEYGFFLPRGVYVEPLNLQHRWAFEPSVTVGAKLRAGDIIGSVQETHFRHHIMIPFNEVGQVEVTWIQGGDFTIEQTVCRIVDAKGAERDVTLTQRWPVRRPIPTHMLTTRIAERLFPLEPLTTTTRIIDTFFPIARGGTACIPGPFGAGKTVLQGLMARYASVDIVIIVACGERAGEVVETITEFPHMQDPRTGGSLMDRTIIICNTSSMPVAAREASIYTGITLGEYYRQMGYNVLLLADSTSRWAQAMRETSGRMEEIPGEEAFPAYLDSSVKGLYERAGVIKMAHGTGSLTLIGTVSPAGGNFEEPVTQSTLGTVKAFLGLSYDRAYKRFYPAIDPLISWSRYLDQLQPYFKENVHPEWNTKVSGFMDLLRRGESIGQMMQVTGEEGISVEDFTTLQKALMLDTVYLQQDAYDAVDVTVPMERQREMLLLLGDILGRTYHFEDKERVRSFFTQLSGLFKNLNYSESESTKFKDYMGQITSAVEAAPQA